MPYNKRIILHLIAIMDLEDLIQCFSYGRLKNLFVFHRSKNHWCRLKYYKDETFVPDFIKVLRYIKKYSSYLITFIKGFIYLTDKIWLEQDFKPSWFDEIILFYFRKKRKETWTSGCIVIVQRIFHKWIMMIKGALKTQWNV